MRVADYVMNRLVNEGVNHIFQVTGRGALFLSDAVAKHEELKSISCITNKAAVMLRLGTLSKNL